MSAKLPKAVMTRVNQLAHREAAFRGTLLKNAITQGLQQALERGASTDDLIRSLDRPGLVAISDLHMAASTASLSALEQFAIQNPMTGMYAAELFQAGIARINITTTLEANEPASHRVMLHHVDEVGPPVEIGAIGCEPSAKQSADWLLRNGGSLA